MLARPEALNPGIMKSQLPPVGPVAFLSLGQVTHSWNTVFFVFSPCMKAVVFVCYLVDDTRAHSNWFTCCGDPAFLCIIIIIIIKPWH